MQTGKITDKYEGGFAARGYAHRGDSGGPCFIKPKVGKTPLLIGILIRGDLERNENYFVDFGKVLEER